ncbi:DUF7010 family protein [Ornithinibacillus halotolerans]|uniref:Uncharacterized protein n=1 Tax=Ornithinibacillus halotolerans TaxID=1274357 RepID=A0A916S7S9_9BACI|nr:hypothetical protein [Ornithinibacillus halotolerans]GGA87117.1 hypothetical protein GCM10008025_32450 [Ornithinibacillus halotolerans]
MNVNEAKLELMKQTKKGIAMFYVGTAFWFLMGLLSFIDMHINLLGLFHLIGIGMLFPLGILVSNLLKIDFIAKDNPLSNLAGILGGMQILFAPILILIYMENIEWLPFFIAVLTGAHFLPFSALYNSKAFIFQSVGVIVFASIIGFGFMNYVYTILPFGLSMIYFVTLILLNIENKKIASISTNHSLAS